ncbi:MAG: hypothetical protein NTV51_22090 [Verrucomicrobia bacterium]|nr:hypothetical protein [Verrucomicrobiota bacterium]
MPGHAANSAQAILARLADETGATSASVQLHDELGRVLSGLYWPFTPERREIIDRLRPMLQTVTLLSGLHDHWWASRPGVAMAVPDSQVLDTPYYELIHRPLGERHLVTCVQPIRENGDQIVITIARSSSVPFGLKALQAMEAVCAEEGAVLSARVLEAGEPFHATRPDEHSVELHPSGQPLSLPPYLEALLASFYGEMHRDANGQTLFPTQLADDVRRCRNGYLRSVRTVDGGDYHAFTRRCRGRVLCLAVQSHPTGRLTLSGYEDVSQYARLRRIKAACRNLERDRSAVFSACLLVAEGVTAPGEIARRSGFGSLKPSSALRIINRARRIVDTL